ncbi:MAG TPA: hypothetical protein VE620_05420 [Myxococcales bacterium]|nr:hypothetical protein [Myxococcales bacterium]
MRLVEFPWWLALALLAACTSTTQSAARARPDLGARLPGIRTAALVALDVKEYEVSAGGIAALKEDWSAAAREAIRDALGSEMRARQIELRLVDPEPDTKDEIEDLRALSEAINASLNFPNGAFDYSLGPVNDLIDRYKVDALVFVWGRAQLPTGGRKVLAALYGRGGADVGMVAMTIVDRSGDLVWYNRRALVGANADLSRAETAAELVRAIVGDLPPPRP